VNEHGGGHVFWNRKIEVLRRGGVCELYFGYVIVYFLSSPYLLVFDDYRVTRYTEANDVSSGASDA